LSADNLDFNKHNGLIMRSFKYETTLFSFAAIILLGAADIVSLAWSPNSEPDLAGYKIYYGNSSRSYHTVLNVGNVTEYTFPAFERSGQYFFAVTAYDTLGNESDFSAEVSTYINGTAGDNPGDGNPGAGSDMVLTAYNFPNPFTPENEVTTIRYYLDQPQVVSVQIYSLANELVRTLLSMSQQPAGEHLETSWDGKDEQGRSVANGIYLGRIRLGNEVQVIKIAVSRRSSGQ